MAIRVLIVEDEILIADKMQRFLEKSGYEVVGIAISYKEAKTLFEKEKPNISLLDIRLSGQKNGIAFAQFLNKTDPDHPFIFLTSQVDRKHIDLAKDTYPSAYLSKPIQKESLLACIEVSMHKLGQQENPASFISLFDGSKYLRVSFDSILYLQVEHVYVKVFMENKESILLRRPLKDILQDLPKKNFVQCHRSYAINVDKIESWDSSKVQVGKVSIPISRARKKEILDKLSK